MVTLVIDPEAVSLSERRLSELGQVKVVPADTAATKQVPFSTELTETEISMVS